MGVIEGIFVGRFEGDEDGRYVLVSNDGECVNIVGDDEGPGPGLAVGMPVGKRSEMVGIVEGTCVESMEEGQQLGTDMLGEKDGTAVGNDDGATLDTGNADGTAEGEIHELLDIAMTAPP